jgi:hypothetical protein
MDGSRTQEGHLPGRSTSVRCHHFRAFGLAIESDFALPGVAAAPMPQPGPRVTIRMAAADEIQERWSGACGPPDWGTILGDGIPIQHELGFAGDQRFIYGTDTFLIAADARTVLCSVERTDDVRWQRQLLDTILFSVSFAHGFELLHASAVEVDGGVVAFVAPSGGGKSSAVVELCRRGYRLFCDDVLTIERRGAQLWGHPGPAVMNVPSSAGLPACLGASLIASFPDEDEVWVALERAATAPLPLRSVYVLDRFAGAPLVSELTAPTVLDLLPHAISLPHAPTRARSRFGVFSALAEQVPIFRLEADPASSVQAIADLVQASLEDASRPLAVC